MSELANSRVRLVVAAAYLFLGRSYESVGIAEICEAAHANKGSFYYHFRSKSELAIAVVDHHLESLWTMMNAAEGRRRGPVNKLSSSADVVGVMQRHLHTTYGRVVGCPLGNLAVELATVDDPAGRHVADAFRQWERRLARHCHDARRQGRLRKGIDPDDLAHQVLATMQGAILLAKARNSDPEIIPTAMRAAIVAATV